MRNSWDLGLSCSRTTLKPVPNVFRSLNDWVTNAVRCDSNGFIDFSEVARFLDFTVNCCSIVVWPWWMFSLLSLSLSPLFDILRLSLRNLAGSRVVVSLIYICGGIHTTAVINGRLHRWLIWVSVIWLCRTYWWSDEVNTVCAISIIK